MNGQALQSVLMLVYHVSQIISSQTYYLYVEYQFNKQPDWFNLTRNNAINYPANFTANTCFLVAHWLFAFDYFRLSYKTKLKNEGRPVDFNKFLLDAFNYCVSTVITSLVLGYVLSNFLGYYDLYNTLFGVVYSFLVLAFVFLGYGLWLLTKIAKLNNT